MVDSEVLLSPPGDFLGQRKRIFQAVRRYVGPGEHVLGLDNLTLARGFDSLLRFQSFFKQRNALIDTPSLIMAMGNIRLAFECLGMLRT